MGIAAKMAEAMHGQANLFVPFFSTKANGQGIGLTLVQEILNLHQFDFTLESKPGGQPGLQSFSKRRRVHAV